MKTSRNIQDCYCNKCMNRKNLKIKEDQQEKKSCQTVFYVLNDDIVGTNTTLNRKAENVNHKIQVTTKRVPRDMMLKRVHKRNCNCFERKSRYTQTKQKIIQISQEEYSKNKFIISRRNKSRHVIKIQSNNYSSSFQESNIMDKKNIFSNAMRECNLINHICCEKEDHRIRGRNEEKPSHDCEQTSCEGDDDNEDYTTVIFIERSGVSSTENNTSTSTNNSSVTRYVIKKKPGLRPKLIYNNGLTSDISNKTCQSHSSEETQKFHEKSIARVESSEVIQKTTDFEKESTVTESSGNISDMERRDDQSTHVMEQTDDCILDDTDSYSRRNMNLTENSKKKANENRHSLKRNKGVNRVYRRCYSSIQCLNFMKNLEACCKELSNDTFVIRENSNKKIQNAKDFLRCTPTSIDHDTAMDINRYEDLEVQTSTTERKEKGTANSKLMLLKTESRSTSPFDFEAEVKMCMEDNKTREKVAGSRNDDTAERNTKIFQENLQTKHLKRMFKSPNNKWLCQCGSDSFRRGLREYFKDVNNDVTIHPNYRAKGDVTVMLTRTRSTFSPKNENKKIVLNTNRKKSRTARPVSACVTHLTESCTSRYSKPSMSRSKSGVIRKGINTVPTRKPMKKKALNSAPALTFLRQFNRIGSYVTSKLSKPKEKKPEPEILKLKLVIPAKQKNAETSTTKFVKSESTMKYPSEISNEISVQTSMDKENGSNTSQTRLKSTLLHKKSVSQFALPRCDKWTNKALMLDKECQLGKPNLNDKGVSVINLIDSNNAEVQVSFTEGVKKSVNKERDSIINSIYQTKEEGSDSYENVSMDEQKKSPFCFGYGYSEPLVLLMNPVCTKPEIFGKSFIKTNDNMKTKRTIDENLETEPKLTLPIGELASQMSDVRSKKMEITDKSPNSASESKKDEYLSKISLLTPKVYKAVYQSMVLLAAKANTEHSKEVNPNKSKPLKSTIIHIRKDKNPLNQDIPKCHFSESFTQTWLKSLTQTTPKTEQEQESHLKKERPTVTIEDTEYLKAYHLAQMKKHLVESCRYFSKIVSRQLDKVKEMVTRELMTSCHKYMEQVTYETTGTMKPSGRLEFSCQTFEELENCKKDTSKDLYTALSLTNIFNDKDRESLKSQYFLLSAIDGRLRRIKKRNCVSFY